jgi:hypothetical protein
MPCSELMFKEICYLNFQCQRYTKWTLSKKNDLAEKLFSEMLVSLHKTALSNIPEDCTAQSNYIFYVFMS